MTNDDARAYASTASYHLDDRGTEHVILLLHGLGGDRNQPLGLVADRFADLGATVLAPDARAHGLTELIGPPGRFTTQALTEDVLALVEHLGLGGRQLIPVGISMGAAIGLELVTQHADRVAGAVLIRPSFGPEPWPPHLQVFRRVARLLRSRGSDGLYLFQQSAQYREHLSISPSAASSLCEQFTKPLAAERVVRLESVPANTALARSEPRQVLRPVTVIGAQDDPGHPIETARQWHCQLLGSRLVEVPSRDKQPKGYRHGLETTTVDAVRDLLHPLAQASEDPTVQASNDSAAVERRTKTFGSKFGS